MNILSVTASSKPKTHSNIMHKQLLTYQQ